MREKNARVEKETDAPHTAEESFGIVASAALQQGGGRGFAAHMCAREKKVRAETEKEKPRKRNSTPQKTHFNNKLPSDTRIYIYTYAYVRTCERSYIALERERERTLIK